MSQFSNCGTRVFRNVESRKLAKVLPEASSAKCGVERSPRGEIFLRGFLHLRPFNC